MPGVNRLETTNMQLSGDIKSKQNLVDSLQTSAETHAANGDDVRAQTDRESAERYLRDIDNLQSQIAANQSLMLVKQQKAKSKKNEMDEITKQYEKEMSKLKGEIDSLV